ncbi:type VII secretion-associated serine protease mycosin [Streptomyces sp. NPDC048638]|uniref:type VII secretion-associated serine protease mycosin n=1 Tax=Streptomyces sp. NPDC048638 TaxID=3365580 RepID=UPI00371219A7
MTHRAVAVLAASLVALSALAVTAPAAVADESPDQCTFPDKPYDGKPWSLQRVLVDELWKQATGKGVRVAVIDTGVDVKNRQLTKAVDAKSGRNVLPKNLKDENGNKIARGKENGTTDSVGHGTKVAGIIAARPMKGTGFVGLAPEATIIPIKQNDAEGHGTAEKLAEAIRYAAGPARADVINISQDTANAVEPTPELKQAVNEALAKKVVIVASAGNDGLGGNVKETYPASYDGVLAVASSDRNNERAAFSQSGDFVDVAAPGVDMISTVPGGGHCSDDGTSFSAPYAAGVAALLKEKRPGWTPRQINAQIMQTAERAIPGHDRLVGWGVVDPVRALTEADKPIEQPVPGNDDAEKAKPPSAMDLPIGETAQDRSSRLGTYVAVGSSVLVAVIAGGAVVMRDARRRANGKADK